MSNIPPAPARVALRLALSGFALAAGIAAAVIAISLVHTALA
jgi:hypothetical protein